MCVCVLLDVISVKNELILRVNAATARYFVVVGEGFVAVCCEDLGEKHTLFLLFLVFYVLGERREGETLSAPHTRYKIAKFAKRT